MSELIILFSEFIASFVLFSVILLEPTAIPISITLCGVIYFAGNVSGAHVNPCVTIMKYLGNKISSYKAIKYIAIQFLSAYLAYLFFNNVTKK